MTTASNATGRKNRLVARTAVAGVFFLAAGLAGIGIEARETSIDKDLTVSPVGERLSDEVIAADKGVFRRVRELLEAAKGVGASDRACQLAKAEAWLNLAEEEYDENEGGPIVDQTLKEAQRLLRTSDPLAGIRPEAGPLLSGPASFRPDLWGLWRRLHERGPLCACGTLARLEVQLVWTDHETLESVSHARPYAEAAERLAEAAEREIEVACPMTAADHATSPVEAQVPVPITDIGPGPEVRQESPDAPQPLAAEPEQGVVRAEEAPPPMKAEPSAPPDAPALITVGPETMLRSEIEPPPAPAVIPESPSDAISLATLPWSVHFPTNGATIGPATAKILNRMGEVLLRYPIAKIRLEGHADQRGDAAYNTALSGRRTQAVKAFLVKTGIPADNISTTALGMSQPLTRSRKNHEMAKNRRVVIIVTNIEEIRSEEQYVDLQPDLRKKRKSTGQGKRGATFRPSKTEKKKRAGAQP